MTPLNFAAGPAALPKEILVQAKAEMFDWKGSGISVLEMPFTGDAFNEILDHARQSLRQLLDIPATHHILFLQGGAYAHYAFLAMNLMGKMNSATYLDTGHWSKRAISEATKYGKINVTNSYDWDIHKGSAYCHLTSNETADGVQIHDIPDLGDVPLIADMTSDILTRSVDFNKFDLIYASAQKNIAPAGLSLVIMHERLFDRAIETTPTVFDYTKQARNNSKVNTPNTFGVYMAGLMFDWVLKEGGVAEMAKRCKAKSDLIYKVIEGGDFYHSNVATDVRSHVNVCFGLTQNDLFLQEANDAGLLNLKGHSASGGVRASLYNALPLTAAVTLANFMNDFQIRHSEEGSSCSP